MRSEFDGIVIENRQTLRDGVYGHNLSVRGTAEFISEVDTDFIEISGEACFDSYVTCDKLTVRGKCMCKNYLLTTSIRVVGGLATYGKINTETIIVGGSLKFRGNLKAAVLSVRKGGIAKGSGNVKASRCDIDGAIYNSGVISTDCFNISSNDISKVQEIITDVLRVEASVGRGEKPSETILMCDFVECFEADIDKCNIDKLYCDKAIIRKGCVINEILYRDSIEIEQGARVERLSKT